MNKRISILDIPFHTFTKQECLEVIEQFFYSKKQTQICTPNPEFLLEGLKNPEFKKVLQNSSLNIADGIGILWAATVQDQIRNNEDNRNLKYLIGLFYLICLLLYQKAIKKVIPERITGTDLLKDIFIKFPDKKIFLLGAAEGVAEQAAKNLMYSCHSEVSEESYPKKQDSCFRSNDKVQCYSGSPRPEDEEEIIDKINKFEPEILFVAYGAPAQDCWIARNLGRMPSVKIAAGIGGAFDFWAGSKKRAPRLFQKLGIEWLFRLIIEPSRWRRIFNAVVVFPWRFLRRI